MHAIHSSLTHPYLLSTVRTRLPARLLLLATMRSISMLLVAAVLLLSLAASVVGQSYTPPTTTIAVSTDTKVSGDQFFGVGYPDLMTLDTLHAPNLTVTMGVTYTFNVNNPSIHPFYIGTSALGEDNGALYGSISSGSFTWTPSASDASQPLFFQCVNHANMGNQIFILAAAAPSSTASASSSSSSTASAASSATSSASTAASSSATSSPLPSTASVSSTAVSSSAVGSSSTAAPTSASAVTSSVSSTAAASSSSSLSPSSPSSSSSPSPAASSSSTAAATSSTASLSSSAAVPPSPFVLPPGTTFINVLAIGKVAGDPFFNVGFPAEYTLNGLHAPTMTAVRGTTYTFNVSVPSEHPFYITTSSVGAGAGSITDNVFQGVLTWTPDATTLSTVFYQCHIHPNLGNAINVIDAAVGTSTAVAAGSSSSTGGGADSINAARGAYGAGWLVVALVLAGMVVAL